MDNHAQEQVEEETRRLVALVEEMAGLHSRWNGRIVLLEDAAMLPLLGRRVSGEKRWGCDILLHSDFVNDPLRWRTLLHEVLHSVSVGMNEQDYRRFRGWEEGTVEWLQRRWRPRILRLLGVGVLEEAFVMAERFWPFNKYLEALQVLQQAAGLDAELFYRDLLRTPLALRLGAVRAMGNEPEFLPLFAQTIGKLR